MEAWRVPATAWALILAAVILACALALDGLKPMVMTWISAEEYGYGFFIPIVILFLIWQKRDVLEGEKFDGSWAGVALDLIGPGVSFLSELATLYVAIEDAVR